MCEIVPATEEFFEEQVSSLPRGKFLSWDLESVSSQVNTWMFRYSVNFPRGYSQKDPIPKKDIDSLGSLPLEKKTDEYHQHLLQRQDSLEPCPWRITPVSSTTFLMSSNLWSPVLGE